VGDRGVPQVAETVNTMEVGKMPAESKANQSKRLTAAGLIAVTAATLLMMVWAIFPTAAFASTESTPWEGNGSQFLPCNNGTLHWIFTGWGNDFGEVSNPVLHVNGQTYPMSQQGNGNVFEAFVPGPLPPPLNTNDFFATWTWDENGDKPSPVLTISGCAATTTTTTTVPTTTTTVPTTTTTVPTTTTTVPTTTTTVPGGGGGGGTSTVPTTTTTTTIATVAPTTIHKSTTTTDEVLATTVRPGGTAFTGVENVVPIGAIALTLMTSGSGLLWAGARRRRRDGSEDED
jgi:hypothetical protein